LAETARMVMLARDFQPNVPFHGTNKPWAGVCLKCAQPGNPHYSSVRKGQGACGYCAGKRVDPTIVFGKMLARDFQPNVPFPCTNKPWAGVCLKCGQPGNPRYNSVQQGGGACRTCSVSGYDPALQGYLYMVEGSLRMKIGITNYLRDRLSAHKRFAPVLLDVWTGSGRAVAEAEKAILCLLRDKSSRVSMCSDSGDAKFGGYTESWQRDSIVPSPRLLPELVHMVEGRLVDDGVVVASIDLGAFGLRCMSAGEVDVELGLKRGWRRVAVSGVHGFPLCAPVATGAVLR